MIIFFYPNPCSPTYF